VLAPDQSGGNNCILYFTPNDSPTTPTTVPAQPTTLWGREWQYL